MCETEPNSRERSSWRKTGIGGGAKLISVKFFDAPIVHWYRNVFSLVPSTKVREVAAMLKAIYAGEDLVAAQQQAAA